MSDSSSQVTRRKLMVSAAAAGTALALAPEAESASKWTAKPPAGFKRMGLPGKVVRVHKPGESAVERRLPKQAAAKAMLKRAMRELTGDKSLKKAFGRFIHKDDVVAIKPNGIAGKDTMKMATNKELVLEVVKAVMSVGVPADHENELIPVSPTAHVVASRSL